MILIDNARFIPNREISIISDELSKMKRTVISDFLKIILDWNIKGQWNKSESKYYFSNGSYIEFLGLDVHDVGKGMRRHVVYGNEANKMKFEAWQQISSRAALSIIDFNPDGKFWGHDLIKENNFITLTYLDNELLGDAEVQAILSYKEKGYYEDGTIKSQYWANKWRVYGLGEIGSVEGRIYFWKPCTLKEYEALDVKEYIGCDWGKVDPFAIVGVKYHDGRLFLHEYHYDSENQVQAKISQHLEGEDERIVPYVFKKCGIPKDRVIITDNNYPTKLASLWANGWDYAQGIKNKWKIVERIALIQEMDVYYTEQSKNIEFEQMNSCWSKDRAGNTIEEREDINDHLINGFEYCVVYLKINGIIR